MNLSLRVSLCLSCLRLSLSVYVSLDLFSTLVSTRLLAGGVAGGVVSLEVLCACALLIVLTRGGVGSHAVQSQTHPRATYAHRHTHTQYTDIDTVHDRFGLGCVSLAGAGRLRLAISCLGVHNSCMRGQRRLSHRRSRSSTSSSYGSVTYL